MRMPELGQKIRRARNDRGLTQAQLAAAARVTRTTLNRLENGVVEDLGIRKINAILEQLGLVMDVVEMPAQARRDFLRIARTTASVSFKDELSESELLRALLTGKIPAGRRPHMRVLLEEAAPAIMEGLVRQVSQWAKPGKVEQNLVKLAQQLGAPEKGT